MMCEQKFVVLVLVAVSIIVAKAEAQIFNVTVDAVTNCGANLNDSATLESFAVSVPLSDGIYVARIVGGLVSLHDQEDGYWTFGASLVQFNCSYGLPICTPAICSLLQNSIGCISPFQTKYQAISLNSEASLPISISSCANELGQGVYVFISDGYCPDNWGYVNVQFERLE